MTFDKIIYFLGKLNNVQYKLNNPLKLFVRSYSPEHIVKLKPSVQEPHCHHNTSKPSEKRRIRIKNAISRPIFMFKTFLALKSAIDLFDETSQSRYGKDTREYKSKARFLKGFIMESFEQITEQYTPMIYSIIRKLHIYKSKDEYFQVGLIALWEAYQRFDSEKGMFTSFAYSYINGRLLTELNNRRKYEDATTFIKEDFLEAIVDEWTTDPLEEEILLSYCTRAKLSENQTKYVLYAFLKGFKLNEIAEIEQVSKSAVKAWRAGAKAKLQHVSLFQ